MIAWLVRLFERPPKPEQTPDATEAKHKATLKRADRLLARVEDYRAADADRRRRHQ